MQPDLLVNLLKLPPLETAALATESGKVVVRRAQPFEITPVRNFIEAEFARAWADEVSVGFHNKPVSVFIASLNKEIVGFAAYECTRRDFFGPTGVVKRLQGSGVGRALLLASLWAMRDMGYVYAIIGRAGPVEFYEKTVGAIQIPESSPGIYTDLLG